MVVVRLPVGSVLRSSHQEGRDVLHALKNSIRSLPPDAAGVIPFGIAPIDDALGGWGSPSQVFGEEVRAAYIEALRDGAHAHAICEEYRAAATLDRLRAAGVPVCIDDFGAGAAAFRYLRDFRVDYWRTIYKLPHGGYLTKNNADNKESGVLTTDRVHLNDAGNKLVAETMLAAIDR